MEKFEQIYDDLLYFSRIPLNAMLRLVIENTERLARRHFIIAIHKQEAVVVWRRIDTVGMVKSNQTLSTWDNSVKLYQGREIKRKISDSKNSGMKIKQVELNLWV